MIISKSFIICGDISPDIQFGPKWRTNPNPESLAAGMANNSIQVQS